MSIICDIYTVGIFGHSFHMVQWSTSNIHVFHKEEQIYPFQFGACINVSIVKMDRVNDSHLTVYFT